MHPINQTLITLLDNQVARTRAALEDLGGDVFTSEPGGDCNSILGIGLHLVTLRRFQLGLLESPLAGQVDVPEACETVDELRQVLDDAADLVREALAHHDPDDWYRAPDPPRDGKWGDEPTIMRFVRPFNDFTNHLGSIRAIRRMCGDPAPRTQ